MDTDFIILLHPYKGIYIFTGSLWKIMMYHQFRYLHLKPVCNQTYCSQSVVPIYDAETLIKIVTILAIQKNVSTNSNGIVSTGVTIRTGNVLGLITVLTVKVNI